MKFTLATSALLLVGAASAANIIEVRQNTIVIPDVGGEISTRLNEAGDAINSAIDNGKDRVNEIGDRIGDAKDDVKDAIGDIKTDIEESIDELKTKAITIVLPTFPTISVDRDAIRSAIDDLKDELEDLEPAWISSMRNGETPAEVSQWLQTAFPTNYIEDVKAAISSEFPTFVRATGNGEGDGDESKASHFGSGVMLGLVSAAAGIVGLAIVL